MTFSRHNGWQSPRTISAELPPTVATMEKITHPPDCCIVQGLWHPGDDFESQAEKARWESKIIHNVLNSSGMATHNIGRLTGLSGAALAKQLKSIVYAFDEASYDVLVKADLSPVPFFDYDRSLCASKSQQFRRKLLAIRDALHNYQHVLWMDIDCIKLGPFPSDFWDKLKKGAPLQAKIRQYMRRKCHWRASQMRVLQGGAFIYCRSIPIIERALDVMATAVEELSPLYPPGTGRAFDDEMALAWVIDEMNGGWMGQDAYRKGWDPAWYTIRGEVWKVERPVFTAR